MKVSFSVSLARASPRRAGTSARGPGSATGACSARKGRKQKAAAGPTRGAPRHAGRPGVRAASYLRAMKYSQPILPALALSTQYCSFCEVSSTRSLPMRASNSSRRFSSWLRTQP